MDLYLGTAASKVYLNGTSIVKPVVGAVFTPAKGGLFDKIEEVIVVSLVFATGYAIDDWLLSIERLFELAQVWQARRFSGGCVSLGCQVDSADGYYLSPVSGGWIEQMGNGPADRGYGSLAVKLHVTRANWWEKAIASVVNLTNLQGDSKVDLIETGLLQVINHTDAGHSGYVAIASTSVLGSLPARTVITYNNSTNDALLLRNLYINHNVYSAPATLGLILEGEAGTGGTATVDAVCSGGYYQAITWSGTAANLLEYWTISGANVDKFACSECHAIARLKNVHAYNDLWFQWQVQYGAVKLWESPWVLGVAGAALQELPLVRVPPWYLSGISASSDMKLCLYARRDSGTNQALDLDYIQLMVQDGYRKLEGIYPIPYNFALRDDGYSGIVDTVNQIGAPGALSSHVGRGSQIMLRPGVAQRLYFLADMDDLTAGIARTGVVSVLYYPRVRVF